MAGARGRWMRQLPRCSAIINAAPVPLGPVGICPSERASREKRHTDGAGERAVRGRRSRLLPTPIVAGSA